MDNLMYTIISRYLYEEASEDEIKTLIQLLGSRKKEENSDADIELAASDEQDQHIEKEDTDTSEETICEDEENFEPDLEEYFYDPV